MEHRWKDYELKLTRLFQSWSYFFRCRAQNDASMQVFLTFPFLFAANSSFSSSTCEKFTLPAFCHFVFIPCRIEENGATNRGERLCREDCQLLKRDICNNEFSNGSENAILKVSKRVWFI